MRLALFQMGQETDTFNPSPTTFEDFESFGLYRGQEMLDKLRGNGTVGGFINVVEASDADIEIVPLSRGWAGAGGRITTDALALLRGSPAPGPAVGRLDRRARHAPPRCLFRRRRRRRRGPASRDLPRDPRRPTCRSSSPSTTTPTSPRRWSTCATRSSATGRSRTIRFETGEASTELLIRIAGRRGHPDDRLAQAPADLAPGAVPDVARPDEGLVRPCPRARARPARAHGLELPDAAVARHRGRWLGHRRRDRRRPGVRRMGRRRDGRSRVVACVPTSR